MNEPDSEFFVDAAAKSLTLRSMTLRSRGGTEGIVRVAPGASVVLEGCRLDCGGHEGVCRRRLSLARVPAPCAASMHVVHSMACRAAVGRTQAAVLADGRVLRCVGRQVRVLGGASLTMRDCAVLGAASAGVQVSVL